MSHPQRPSERNILIAMHVMHNKPMTRIAEIYGITPARVAQIVSKVCLYLRPDLWKMCQGSGIHTRGRMSVRKLKRLGVGFMDDLITERLMFSGAEGLSDKTYLHLKSQVSRLKMLLAQTERDLSTAQGQIKAMGVRVSGLDRQEAQVRQFAAHNVVLRKTIEAIRKEIKDSDVMTQKVHDE